MNKPKFIARDGMKKTDIENADSVSIITPDGQEIELTWRYTDNCVSLSSNTGTLIIKPRSANVVRVEVEP